jgi:hypothetical protein
MRVFYCTYNMVPHTLAFSCVGATNRTLALAACSRHRKGRGGHSTKETGSDWRWGQSVCPAESRLERNFVRIFGYPGLVHEPSFAPRTTSLASPFLSFPQHSLACIHADIERSFGAAETTTRWTKSLTDSYESGTPMGKVTRATMIPRLARFHRMTRMSTFPVSWMIQKWCWADIAR